jgi:hypothetical protein
VARGRFQLMMICLLSLTVVLIAIVGGMSGCEKGKGPQIGDQENGDEDANGNGDGTQAEGFSGVAFVRDDYIYLADYLEDEEKIDESRLTDSASGYGDLAFSPKGTKLAATKVEGDALPQLVIIDIESEKMTEVSWTNEDYSGAWTAADLGPWFGGITWASEGVLYCTAQRSVSGEFRYFVVKYDLSKPEVEIIAKDAANPALNPDGDKLAYISMPSDWAEIGVGPWSNLDPGDLMVMDLESGDAERVSINRDGGDRGFVFDAAFSPDGKHMVVDCYDEPDTELYYTGLNGNILYVLDMVGPAGRTGHPSFSPDGDYVIYHSAFKNLIEEPYEYTMFIAPTGAANPEVIDLGGGMYPAWSPMK